MPNPQEYRRFLEPIFLNEQMVLNTAAYLSGGVVTEIETTDQKNQTQQVSGGLTFPFLNQVLGISGSVEGSTASEQRARRTFTLGGLHMNVLNTLNRDRMIKEFQSDNMTSYPESGDSFVDIRATLRPSEYVSLLAVLRTLTPLVGRIAQDFGNYFIPELASADRPQAITDTNKGSGRRNHPRTGPDASSSLQKARTLAKDYEEFAIEIIRQLETDYLTSSRLEMVMWSKTRPIGIVELDITGLEPNHVRTQLSGIKCHVIGKVMDTIEARSSFSLLEKTFFIQALDVISRIGELDRFKDDQSTTKINITAAREMIEKVVTLTVDGPAVRVLAMSVCI